MQDRLIEEVNDLCKSVKEERYKVVKAPTDFKQSSRSGNRKKRVRRRGK